MKSVRCLRRRWRHALWHRRARVLLFRARRRTSQARRLAALGGIQAQSFHRGAPTGSSDRALERVPVSRLSIELAVIGDLVAEASTRHTESIADRSDDQADRFVPMHMLVRVDMGGIASHQPPEPVELADDLQLDRRRVVLPHNLIKRCPFAVPAHPFTQIEVQADTQPWRAPRVLRRRRRPRPVHHQAGTRDDSVLMAPDDTFVDARRLTEIVGVDDETSPPDFRRRRLRHVQRSRSAIRAASSSQS